MSKRDLEALRDKRELVLRLVMAELLAPPGEGPLAPRFRRGRPPPVRAPEPAKGEEPHEP